MILGVNTRRAAQRALAAYNADGWHGMRFSLDEIERTIIRYLLNLQELREKYPEEDFLFISSGGIHVQYNRFREDETEEVNVFFKLGDSFDEEDDA